MTFKIETTNRQGMSDLFGEKSKDFKLLTPPDKTENENTQYIVLLKDQTPAAYAKIYSAPWNESIESVEVHPDHRGQRLGQIVLEEAFRYAEQRSGAVLISAYTADGSKYLFPAIPDLEKKYPALNVIHHQSC